MKATEPPPGADAPDGVVRSVRSFLAACSQYLSARLRLASLEGREAGAQVLKLVLLGGAAIFCALFAWLFLCLALVSLLAKAFGEEHGWLWASLLVAAVHLAGAVVLVLGLKAKVHAPLFPLTTEEFKKDQSWLEEKSE